jgi:hypothetical protein
MNDKKLGLYGKYRVERLDGSSAIGGKHEGCNYYVLDIEHDKYALPSLKAYADACQAEYPLLAEDILKLIKNMSKNKMNRPIKELIKLDTGSMTISELDSLIECYKNLALSLEQLDDVNYNLMFSDVVKKLGDYVEIWKIKKLLSKLVVCSNEEEKQNGIT